MGVVGFVSPFHSRQLLELQMLEDKVSTNLSLSVLQGQTGLKNLKKKKETV